ncbi:MAG: cation diffusion facilitator family transporter [Planctomycetota bacterium]
MTHSHAHDHHHHHHHDMRGTPERALWVAIILNGMFLVVEVVVGLISNSLALLADAGHMLSDVGALVIALVALRLAKLPPKGNYSFGLKRVPVLGGLINAATLLVIVAVIVKESIERLAAPPKLTADLILVTGVLGLIINLLSAWYLHRSGDHSVNIRGAMLHMLADALGSVAVIVGGVVIMTTGAVIIDPILGMLVALLILVATWPLLRDTVNILLQRAPHGATMSAVQQLLTAAPGVARVADLHVWELNTGQFVLTVTADLAEDLSLDSANARADEIRVQLREQFGIVHCTFEWRAPGRPATDCLFEPLHAAHDHSHSHHDHDHDHSHDHDHAHHP